MPTAHPHCFIHCVGLSQSVVDPQGFTWDMGGHVIFSHYQYFTQLLDNLVPEYNHREREAWVWMRERFVPYPLQNNIWSLPTALCISDSDIPNRDEC
jgi:protoporphyrinogen oxidase